ncbi:hypothetical protein [Pengzhenrongella sp.]|jgi:hypothetical protein|uniref:hypothetical protein n=1 Tax=Pengzhenrongella sp. TaxID=2888820 RepID=UPI002F954815
MTPALLGLAASLSARPQIDPADVSPGLLGFIPVFLIALAVIGLGLSMTSKLRKVNKRQALLDAADAAAAKAAGQDGPGASSRGSGSTAAGDSPTDTPSDGPARP